MPENGRNGGRPGPGAADTNTLLRGENARLSKLSLVDGATGRAIILCRDCQRELLRCMELGIALNLCQACGEKMVGKR